MICLHRYHNRCLKAIGTPGPYSLRVYNSHYENAKWCWIFFCRKIGKPDNMDFDTFAMQCVEGKIKHDFRSGYNRFTSNA